MPPPTIAIIRRARREPRKNLCGRPSEALPGQVLKRRRKQRRIIERLGRTTSGRFQRKIAEADIDVVKDLDVVAEKADGLDYDRGVASWRSAVRVSSTVDRSSSTDMPWL